MTNDHEPSALLSSQQQTLKLQAALMARFEQREARMHAAFDQRMQALQDEAARVRRQVDQLVNGAGARIAEEARDAMVPLAARYDDEIATASAQLQRAGRTLWTWFAAAGAILLLVALAGWSALGYYRRELAAVTDELQRYEHAVPIVRAFYAADAALCGERLCVNLDPSEQRFGDKKQYRQVKLKPPR